MHSTARNREIIDSEERNNQKTKFRPCGESRSKSCETSASHKVNKFNSFDLPPRRIGDDGHYYECVICDNGGDLLCCDTCPGTYHLQCLTPPLELVPSGNWQCENCCQAADLLTPLKYLEGLKRNASNENATNHVGDQKETETSTAVNEIKVYRRRVRKKDVELEDNHPRKLTRVNDSSEIANEDQKDIPAIDTSGLFNPSSIKSDQSAEQADEILENDDLSASRSLQPKESNQKPVEEQGGETVYRAGNINVCTNSPKTDQYDKLWILRDVMQESMNGQHFKQDNVGRDLQQALHPYYTESGKAKKEKFARLRARQKQKLALRCRSRGLISSSGIVGQEPLVQLRRELGEAAKEKKTSIDKLLYKTSDQFHGHSNCFQNLPITTDPRRWQTKFVGNYPGCSSHQADAGCSPRIGMSYQKSSNPDVSLQMLIPPAISIGENGRPWMNSASNLSSTSQLSGCMTEMSRNLRKDEAMVDVWLEEELDSLWIGVRRHGPGNWERMLRDPSLSFSKHKTIEDLSQRWKKERLRILNPGILRFPRNQLPSSRGNRAQPNLLLGGLINIANVKIDQEVSRNSGQVHRHEGKELSSEGTISD
ncbi:uncharacterized protein LOC8259971 [Ricinus communis]|uniref:uncharacterized protein LOC8259971 n=1 Tax=Ricinus communis TaxID=3988 RepID=UPI0007723BF2|nr:uncharacterized protein LOC8259971 [Ricinus communis]XP_015571174.2 uncharacterized protein LOC8259971 [Ricinus communis]|eukprot:XP_015571173.1 uncharacterized protein LOC8259971 isoform X2 [Ricinus communis]